MTLFASPGPLPPVPELTTVGSFPPPPVPWLCPNRNAVCDNGFIPTKFCKTGSPLISIAYGTFSLYLLPD